MLLLLSHTNTRTRKRQKNDLNHYLMRSLLLFCDVYERLAKKKHKLRAGNDFGYQKREARGNGAVLVSFFFRCIIISVFLSPSWSIVKSFHNSD